MTLVATKPFFLGYANVMRFKKQGQRDPAMRREVTLRCTACGHAPIAPIDTKYVCSRCGSEHETVNGVSRCVRF